ncbi:siphovirus Gp157 family protein [Chitiniphilus shinanonensis]|uniref:siphovirus Gp157 family protein n=1 Tax=Chitiniphilus shinanonensis TaxID=553088 RepID=UPI00303B501E
MKLYEISAEYLTAFEDLTQRVEDGELSPDVLADTLEGLAGEWADKALAVAKYIATLEAEAAAIKAVEQSRQQQRKAKEAQADKLRAYLAREMARTGLKPKDAEVALSLRPSQAVAIDDEAVIPADYWREIPARREIDKTLISKSIRDGFAVPGAHLEIRQSVQIR